MLFTCTDRKNRSLKVKFCKFLSKLLWFVLCCCISKTQIKAKWRKPVLTVEMQPYCCCGYLSMSFARFCLRSFRSQILTSRTSIICRTSTSTCSRSSRLEASVFSALWTWSSNSVFLLSRSCRHIHSQYHFVAAGYISGYFLAASLSKLYMTQPLVFCDIRMRNQHSEMFRLQITLVRESEKQKM